MMAWRASAIEILVGGVDGFEGFIDLVVNDVDYDEKSTKGLQAKEKRSNEIDGRTPLTMDGHTHDRST